MSHITFYFEDDDHKTVYFNGERYRSPVNWLRFKNHNCIHTFIHLCIRVSYKYICVFMNLNMITPKNETENLLLSITKNCETLIEQTHRNPEETLEFKMAKPRETFHFKPPIQVKGHWMIGLVDL